MFELDVYLRDRLIGRTTFDTPEVRIGRGADNELQIDNLALSRYHASIENIDGLYVIKDFGSQNGTFVNGEKVPGRRALNDGDRIGLGKFVVIFRCEAKPTDPTPREIRMKEGDADFAVAGETLVAKQSAEMKERACPHVGYLAPSPQTEKPATFPIGRDVFLVGAQAGCDVQLDGGPARAVAILRGWRGFSLVPIAPGVKRNGEVVELRSELMDGDAIDVGGRAFLFHTGTPEAGP